MKIVVPVLALVAMIGVLLVTGGHGPGLSPDAAAYLSASESLAHGQAPHVSFSAWSDVGETQRLRHFPPGFPLLIALIAAFGLDPIQAARLVMMLAGGATVALSALAVGEVAGVFGAAFAGVMVLLTPMIARSHAVVLSEPLFLTLLLLAMLLMVRAPQRAWSLGLVVASAALVRYAGLALVVAAALWMLCQPGALSARIRRAAVVVLPALVAITLWNRFTGPFRHYGYRPNISQNLAEGWQTLARWLVPLLAPSGLQSGLAICLLVGGLLMLWSEARRASDGDSPSPKFQQLLRASLLLAACYGAVVVASRLFADAAIPFDWRLLSPVVLLAEIAFAAALIRAWDRWPKVLRASVGIGVGLWLLGSAWALAKATREQYAEGWEYEGPAWQQSQLTHWLRNEGGRYQLYSNHPAAIWLLSHRTSRLLPTDRDATMPRALAAQFESRPSAVLEFAEPLTLTASPTEIAAELGLSSPLRLDRATVWCSDGCAPLLASPR